MHFNLPSSSIPIGNTYISDGSGRLFTSSLDSVTRGAEFVDIEKVYSLEGVYFANKYVHNFRNKRTVLSVPPKEFSKDEIREK